MYLMAAFPAYCKSTDNRGSSRGRGSTECMASSSGVGNSNGSTCSAPVDYGLLEIDENDNSFPWGLIHHNELAHMLNSGLGKTMVIDSRSFLEYNTSTIQQAVNVCCSKLVKRRLQQDKVHVLDLLNQTCNIGADASWDVIVYDQCTEDPSQLTSDNFVAVLLHKLSTTFNSVAFLKGGFLAFQASHPCLTENKSSSHRCSTLTSLSQPCMPVSNVGPTRILPFLYLGSQQDSLNQELAQVNGITYILNVSKTCPRPPFILEGHFYRIPVNDNYGEKLLPFFPEAFQFLDKVREANGCVLVHCLGGVSRSATLAIAYIMRYYRMSSDEAYRYVKDKRPTISPNFNFLGQLLEYEKILRQEEQEEVARRKMLRDEEGMFGEFDRASSAVMDLHTSSPSSPGPRTAHKPFILDFSSPHLQSPLVSATSQKSKVPEQLMQTEPITAPTLVQSSRIYRKLKVVDLLHFQGPSSESCTYPEPPLESCPFPGPSSELCFLPGPSPDLCLLPEQLTLSSNDSKPPCFNVGEHYHHFKTSTTLTSINAGHDICPLTPETTPFCDKTRPETITAQSPVCPITGFPSPASSIGDFPGSTCTKTGFPGPGLYGIGSSSSTTVTRQTQAVTPDSSNQNLSQLTRQTETLFKKTTYHKLTETIQSPLASTETIWSPLALTETIRSPLALTETIRSPPELTETIQSPSELTETIQSLSELTRASNHSPSPSHSNQDLFSKTSHKAQSRSRGGFSLSSMLSSLRWKVRPPTLSLGSPVGGGKEVNRHSKKHMVENNGVGDGRVQLTPVSEAVENCDLALSEVAPGGMNESVAANGLWPSECPVTMEHNGFSDISASGSSLFNATNLAMASIQSNSSSSSSSMSMHTNSLVVTYASTTSHIETSESVTSHGVTSTSVTSRDVTSTSATSSAPSSLIKPIRLNISARKFSLPLSSPTSDFSISSSYSSLLLPSPGDSNKRKIFPPSTSDSPDKLAKTDICSVHARSPPRTLNLAQGLAGKMRPRFLRRPFVLPLSSPTTGTMEEMARLKVTSPSDPPAEETNLGGLKSSQDLQKCFSLSTSDLELKTNYDVIFSASEAPRRRFLKSSDPQSLSESEPYRYTKWKSATSLFASGASMTNNPHGGEAGTPNQDANSQKSENSSLDSWASSRSSISAMTLSTSSSLSKSCTSIYSSSTTSSSVRKSSFSSSSSCSMSLQGFSQFPTTSLDKLSFTPCYTKDIVQELKNQETELLTLPDQGTSPPECILGPSVLDSPMSISSGSSAPSIVSSTLSPVESTMSNVFTDGTFNAMNHNSGVFHFAPSQIPPSDSMATSNFGSPEGSPNSVLSPTSVSDFMLSPSSMPQSTVAPTTPTFNSPYYSSSQSMEPLSPMSLSDSASSSPLRSPTRNSLTSPIPSSISTPASSLSSPLVSSPPFSPFITSPMSSSSHVAVTTVSSAFSTKVVLRRDKNKRVIDRPNSIAFSSYPACDLVPVTPGNQEGQGQASLDDSSEAYMSIKSKRSRRNNPPETHIPHGRTSWGGYSEREMYRQITAAMENAMLRTQVFSSGGSSRRNGSGQISSRKSRSLDDIVDSNGDEDDFMTNQPNTAAWNIRTDQCMFDRYRCSLQNVSEPYHSSSSLSSNGSHGGSMEIKVS